MNTLPGWARTTNQSHQPFEHTLTNQIIWPWTDAYYGHTGSMDADLYGTELATAILSNNLTLQTYKWENSSHTWTAKKGDGIQIGYRVFNVNVIISRHPLIQTVRQPPFTQIVIRDKTESKIAQTRCESETCWYAFTATQPVSIVCLGGTRSGDQAISFRFPLNIQEETTTITTHAPKETTQTTHTVPTQPTVVLSPKIFKIGPYAIRNTGKQQMLFNPAWSLKQVELLIQNNVSNIQPACSPFLKTSYEGWTTWLQKQTPHTKRTQRDLTGALGTGLGVLNSIDSEVIMNKLTTSISDLTNIQRPLRSSLLALGANQWLLSNILPKGEKVNIKDHELITDALSVLQNNLSLTLSCIQAQIWMQSIAASIIREGEEGILPTEIRRIIWDSATNFEKKLQSWWNLVNFTYDPITNTATTFILTIYNATIYQIYPIIALGLNHNGTILYPSEHRVWARKVNEKWQTVNLESYIVREQQGFICEGNAIEAQNICLDTEQNICHFEVHPNENPKTVLIYIGEGCVCLRTVCEFLTVDKIIIETKNYSNLCVCNFTKVIGCDFSYLAPVTSYQLLQSNYTLIHNLQPTPIGMNLTLVKQLLQHKDLVRILEKVRENGQKTLITVHHNVEEIHRVLERAKKNAEHNWWDTLFGWSPTATGILNKLCHPIVVLLILILISLTLSIILYVITWRMMQRVTYLMSVACPILIKAKNNQLDDDFKLKKTLLLSQQELQRFDEQNDKKKKGGL
ncbi:uncharacterized protein LOC141933198 [Strix aluco]|uniref:uncharacterized protein LOC141933198 n=1 Tax=Strix aluco TaxID=111821 RepID=UPI003DA5B967